MKKAINKKIRSELIIPIKSHNITIGNNNIAINDKFTLILGKFEKEIKNQFQFNDFFEVIKDFSLINIKDISYILEKYNENYKNSKISVNILNFINKYRAISQNNADVLERCLKIIRSLIEIINYNLILKRREVLNKELQLAIAKKYSSELATKSDLLNKLNESINKSKKNLGYFKEDYLILKNQRDQIQKNIDGYNLQIKELLQQKKDIFKDINKITREMDNEIKTNDKEINKINAKNGVKIATSEKIKNLQKKGNEIQYKINLIKKDLTETELKFQEVNPKFEELNETYQSMLNSVKNDEIKFINLKEELKSAFEQNSESIVEEIDFNKIELVKTPQEIEREISILDDQLKAIINIENVFKGKDIKDLQIMDDKINEISEFIEKNENNFIISTDETEILNSFKEYQLIKNFLSDLEIKVNKFLTQINLQLNLQIMLNEKNEDLSVYLKFFRGDKEEVPFDNLTTPEKIFFLIIFFVSFQIILKIENIIFSNLLLPTQYNKRGSVFRTISKILSVFELEKELKEFNLIFIVSNLELKKEINNIKIINIEKI